MIFAFAFLASGCVVVFAGAALARFADEISDATKIGRLWVGSVLLAGATSLPELMTDVAAVRLGATDLAVGDLFGSSMANMLILAVIDLLPPRKQVLQNAALDHSLAASLAISLNALAAGLVVIQPQALLLGWVGPGPVALFFIYLAGTRAIYRHATRDQPKAVSAPVFDAGKPARPLRRCLAGFSLSALVVLATAPILAWSAKGIAAISELGNTFVGTWLVGLATSLPELAACLAAVRMGSFDLAVGNLFGSNAFNMALFLALDMAQAGSLFLQLDPNHALSGLFAIILMSLGVAAIVYRAKRRFSMLEPGSLLILAGYVMALWLLGSAGRP